MLRSRISTYSIVGRCGRTGEFGAAVASAVPAVGGICLYMRPRVGAVSTQSWVNPYLALALLESLAAGSAAAGALQHAVSGDPASEFRQLGVIGPAGDGAAWTGSGCTGWCGHRTAPDHAVQGNMLTGPEVLDAMSSAFGAGRDLALDERLMSALEAGQAVGGDRRGRQSAALAVIGAEDYRRVDLRVDEHARPVAELRRVHGVAARQLAPFVAGMPRRGEAGAPAPDEVVDMLLKPPPDRPGGGGSRRP
jgi:uncharacterized Ntn-hydrolase superfamily protein